MKHTLLLSLFFLPFFLFAQEKGCTVGDCENGKGRFIFDNGDKYIGEFKESQMHGRGNYSFKNGNVYKGQFRANKRHGYGHFFHINGEQYIGEYVNNWREGEGTYKWPNGESFSGIFKSNQIVGEGVYTYADGSTAKVRWNNGQFETISTLVEEDIKTVTTDKDPLAGSNIDPTNIKGLVLPALSHIPEGKKRLALVFGNSTYEHKPLKNPQSDALAMAEELQRSGFEVMLYTNAKQEDMKRAIRDFGQKLKEEGGIGLFFYTGHGLQADGRNYLVPVNADIRKVQDIEFESVDLGRVLVEMDYAGNELNIVILDACRDNPYKKEFKSSRNTHNGLASINSAPYNSFIAFSTSPGAVAKNNPKGEHSLYVEELLTQMRQPNIQLEDIFKTVRRNVRKASEGVQIPWELSSIEDDFYFKQEQ
ncbi:caspase family protein [Saprospira sp. CCB-QB6]|uniref:caspase family protein n=1 Tax=Saprospira sp. CCB-QB6 TaxID=3023936 RepID=UPI002349FC47|nr:caspase family protein [Saprospira sp. CCB-QB6]WCL80423.1 caspase family protein [Saprospira sp. CCB-QB6]